MLYWFKWNAVFVKPVSYRTNEYSNLFIYNKLALVIYRGRFENYFLSCRIVGTRNFSNYLRV